MEFNIEQKVYVEMTDRYGNTRSETITVWLPEDRDDFDIETMIEDVVTQWYYENAEDVCQTVWTEMGSGTDYEYEEFLDNYLMDCTIIHELVD